MTQSTDPYLYPGTDVLKNLRDIREHDLLSRFEAEATSRRIIELVDSPLSGNFDLPHLKAIHKHIFQDVYAWAGEFRTVNISKEDHLFGSVDFVAAALRNLLQQLAEEKLSPNNRPEIVCGTGRILFGRNQCCTPIPRRQRSRAKRIYSRAWALCRFRD